MLPRSQLAPLLTALREAPRAPLAEALAAWAQRSSEVAVASGGLVAELLSASEAQLASSRVVDLRAVACVGHVLDLWSLDKTG